MATRGMFHIYERRGKGSRWHMIDQATTSERAKEMSRTLVKATSFYDQQARVKNADTGNWVRNSLVTQEMIEAEGGSE